MVTSMSKQFDELVRLMAQLRAPEGCPWDRKQTHESLKPYLLEETYEVLETIDRNDTEKLQEELGDVLLQILFHAQIGAERNAFTIDAVLAGLADKLVRRHPHVFDKDDQSPSAMNADQVYARWEQIKRGERKESGQPHSALDGVPPTLPALLRAYQVQARASRVGFDWPKTREGVAELHKKIEEELREFREAIDASGTADLGTAERTDTESWRRIEAEFGDILFALVNLARFLKINPEDALRQTTNRFTDRFHLMESAATDSGQPLESMTLPELDALWDQAKRKLASH